MNPCFLILVGKPAQLNHLSVNITSNDTTQPINLTVSWALLQATGIPTGRQQSVKYRVTVRNITSVLFNSAISHPNNDVTVPNIAPCQAVNVSVMAENYLFNGTAVETVYTAVYPTRVTHFSATISNISFAWETPVCTVTMYELNVTVGCESVQRTVASVRTYSNESVESIGLSGLQHGSMFGLKIRTFFTDLGVTSFSDSTLCTGLSNETNNSCPTLSRNESTNSSVAFYELDRQMDSSPIAFYADIYNNFESGQYYFGVMPENNVFVFKMEVLRSKRLLPFEQSSKELQGINCTKTYYGDRCTFDGRQLSFFGISTSTLYINQRGFVSIGEPYLNPWSYVPFPLTGNVPMLAAFWWWYTSETFIQNYQEGNHQYDNNVIEVVKERLHSYGMINNTFQPDTVLCITWKRVSTSCDFTGCMSHCY